MIFCNNCGRQNNGTTKFCTGCGRPMSPGVQSIQSNPAAAYPEYAEPEKSNKALLLALGIAAVLSIAILVYFVVREPASTTDSIAVADNSNAATQNDAIKAETIAEIPEPKREPGENITAEQHVRNYFEITTTQDFDNIYPYLTNCLRYYSDYNPTRESIYKAATGYWSKVTNITQTINYVTVENTENGKNVLVNMEYSFFSIKDQVQKTITNLSLNVQLDNSNNILQVYELSRDK
jgi:hypothetical protein